MCDNSTQPVSTSNALQVLAKFITSIPGVLLLALISSVIVVFSAKLNGFPIYFLDLFLSLLVAESFMAFIAAAVPHYIIGIALAAGIFGKFTCLFK